VKQQKVGQWINKEMKKWLSVQGLQREGLKRGKKQIFEQTEDMMNCWGS